eukprot:3682434-Rhodomonas_salina.5
MSRGGREGGGPRACASRAMREAARASDTARHASGDSAIASRKTWEGNVRAWAERVCLVLSRGWRVSLAVCVLCVQVRLFRGWTLLHLHQRRPRSPPLPSRSLFSQT